MINFILWLIVGGVIGWLAGMVMGRSQGVLLNIIVGIVGAFLGGFIFSLFGFTGANINSGDFSLPALIVSFLGAIVLLAIVGFFQRSRASV